MKSTQRESKYARAVVYLVSFCILLYIFWDMPLFSDDFEFADLVRTKSVAEVIEYILYYGNGRLLGNTMAILLVNSGVAFSAFVKAAVVLGIVILLPRVFGIRSLKAFLLSFLLVMGVAPQIYAQVFVWTSGFANYVLSIFASLLGAYLMQKNMNRSLKYALLFISGLAGQLFVEHGTIMNLLASGGTALWFHVVKKQEARESALVWLCGCLVGAVTMFVLPSVFYVDGNRTEGYRDIHFESFADMVFFAIGQFSFMIVTLSRCTALFAVTSCFGWSTHRWVQGGYSCLARAVYITFPVISLLFNINEGMWIPSLIRYVVVYGGLMAYCVVLMRDLFAIKNKNTKCILLALLVLAMISAAPFLIITPFGERCLFLAYTFLALFALKAVHFATDQTQVRVVENKWLLPALAILLSAFLCGEMASIRKWDVDRNAYIEECMEEGQSAIQISEVPSPYYTFQYYLLERWYYYESWGDISFKVVEYDEWTP